MPHISKQIVRELIETLDVCGVGAHHPDLLALLDQPEEELVAWQMNSPFSAGKWVGISKDQCEIVEQTDAYTQEPRITHTRRLYTHPPAPLKMLDDDEFAEVSCHPITGKDAIKAFCAKNDLTLEKL